MEYTGWYKKVYGRKGERKIVVLYKDSKEIMISTIKDLFKEDGVNFIAVNQGDCVLFYDANYKSLYAIIALSKPNKTD